MLQGDGWADVSLKRCLAERRAQRDLLEVHEEQLREVEAKISACIPTPETAAERRENQQALVALAEERLALDAEVDAALDKLRGLLEQRKQLTARMAERAHALEMEFDLDQDRFDALVAVLPANVARQSRAWSDRLLGRERLPVQAVARERLVRGETLAHSGIYQVGDTLALTQEEFAGLHRADRPEPQSGEPWLCKPQSVFTVEEYEAALAEAKRKGIKVEEVAFWQDIEVSNQGKKNYLVRQFGPAKAAELMGK